MQHEVIDELDDNETDVSLDDAPGDPDKPDRGDTLADDGDNVEDESGNKAKPAVKASEEAAPAEDAKPARPSMIPASRFNEVNERMKALTTQNQQLIEALTARTQPATPATAAEPGFDLEAKEREAMQAMLDGDDAKAVKLRMEINRNIKDEATAEAEERVTQRQEQRAFQTVALAIKDEYPQLDERGEGANPSAIRYVVAERDALVAEGKSATEALRIAADVAAKLFGFGKPTPSAPATDTRAIDARARNAKAANQQPAPLAGVGDRATAAQREDVEQMSDDEFASISASEKKRMRGD